VLRTFDRHEEAYSLINEAIDLGINYCESARAYSGSESYYGNSLKERRKDVFLTSKSHARDKKGALLHLHLTLKNMKTDYLDLWQVHDVRTQGDIKEIFGPGGAIEAFVEAKQKGLVRFVGVTGHHDPAVLCSCIEMHDFDTVLLPVNPAELEHSSFPGSVIPLARSKNMGIIGMKVYLRGLVQRLPKFTGMEPFLHFALSQPITTAVLGCDSTLQLRQNVEYAKSFRPMSEADLNQLAEDVEPFAKWLMYYKP